MSLIVCVNPLFLLIIICKDVGFTRRPHLLQMQNIGVGNALAFVGLRMFKAGALGVSLFNTYFLDNETLILELHEVSHRWAPTQPLSVPQSWRHCGHRIMMPPSPPTLPQQRCACSNPPNLGVCPFTCQEGLCRCD